MLFASLLVQIVIAGDSVGAGGGAGDDGQVVGVRQGRHCARRSCMESALQKGYHVWQNAILDPILEVFGVEPVDADNDRRTLGESIGLSMEGNGRGKFGRHSQYTSWKAMEFGGKTSEIV